MDSVLEIIEGTLGAGKTYFSVTRMVDALRAGQVVATNVALNRAAFHAYARRRGWDFSDSLLVEHLDPASWFHEIPTGDNGTLVVVDEAGFYYDCRDWQKITRPFVAALTQARKLRVSVLFICQALSDLDKKLIRRTQFVWRLRDLRKLQIFGVEYPFSHYLLVCWDARALLQQGIRSAEGGVLSWRVGPWDKEVFGLYDSKAVFQAVALRRVLGGVERLPLKERLRAMFA